MNEIRYPPEPLEGETRQEYYDRVLRPWRMDEKRKLLRERGPMCARPGCLNRSQDLDESILTRQEMRGLPLWKYRLAFCNVNLELACARHNRESAQDREGAWERACARYTEKSVREWYAGLELRAPRKGWL